MKTGDTLYMVKNCVDPADAARFLHWMENKHMPDVLALPGVLWGRKVALEEKDERGWDCHLLIYGFESRDALEAYLTGDARKGFWEELKAFEDIHDGERFFGTIDFSVGG